MLTEERYSRILAALEQKGSVTTAELMVSLGASESTIRRDLNSLAQEGALIKVHGGAIPAESTFENRDDEVLLRRERNIESKIRIAKYAAGLIVPGDFVYLDAGTTTEEMIAHIKATDVTFVTNAISHARALGQRGFTCYILGGEFKSITEAIVGEEAVLSASKYNFTKGFFGVNGITRTNGFTTPEVREAMVKQAALTSCKECYVLADGSKFGQSAAVSFGEFDSACVITTGDVPKQYKSCTNIMEVK